MHFLILAALSTDGADRVWMSLTVDEGINELCRRCLSFMAYSTANENISMAEGFEVKLYIAGFVILYNFR